MHFIQSCPIVDLPQNQTLNDCRPVSRWKPRWFEGTLVMRDRERSAWSIVPIGTFRCGVGPRKIEFSSFAVVVAFGHPHHHCNSTESRICRWWGYPPVCNICRPSSASSGAIYVIIGFRLVGYAMVPAWRGGSSDGGSIHDYSYGLRFKDVCWLLLWQETSVTVFWSIWRRADVIPWNWCTV